MSLFRRSKRSKIKSNGTRLRLSVYRSLAHIYAQIIDDVSGLTVASASSLQLSMSGNVKSAKEVGRAIAEAAKKANVKEVVFDRGNRIYHGRIKALADSAREHGLRF